MFDRKFLVAVPALFLAVPAFAQSCASPPIAPALASPAEIRQQTSTQAAAAKHDAFVQIRNWQADLKEYRACLTNVTNQDRRQVGTLDPQKDADKIEGMKREAAAASHAYDATVDMEERVVNEFHALQAAYCTRTDVDRASCPK